MCNSESIAERARSLRNLCFSPERRFVHHQLGYNYRMSNLQAALGVAQLEKIENSIIKKRYIGRKYQNLLGHLSDIQLPLAKTSYASNIYWVFGIVLGDEIPIDALEFEERLNKKGVGTRPFFWGMHEQPVFVKQGFFKDEHYPVAEKIARRGFYIPSGLTLEDGQLDYVAAQICAVMGDL